MSNLYLLDKAIVRFWDTHNPHDAVRRRGDLEVVCVDCLFRHHELPVSHPGVHTLKPSDLDEFIINACSYCGKEDTRIHKLQQRWWRRLFFNQ